MSTVGGPGVRTVHDSPTESVACDHAEAFREGTGLTRSCTTTRWVVIAGIVLVVEVLIVPQLTVVPRTGRDTLTHTTKERHHREAAIRTLLVQLRTPVIAVIRELVTGRGLRVRSVEFLVHVAAEGRAADDSMHMT
jgi:hypothetical protein